MAILFVHRKTTSGQFSIERVFKVLVDEIGKSAKVASIELPFITSGLLNILRNILFLKKMKSNVIHISGDVHYACLAFPKHRTLLTVHDVESIVNGSGIKYYIKKLLWFTWPLKRCSFVTVISEFTKNQLLEIADFPESRVKVIYNPILPGFIFEPKKRMSTVPILLQIGTKQNKNLIRLISSLSGISCKLCIVGRLNAEQKELLLVNGVNYQNFENVTNDEMLNLYKSCDILTYVSTYEGFGMPVVEAQAIGRPVLASDIPVMKEVSGDAVRYVDPLDVDSIRNGILELVQNQNLRDELVQKGLSNVKRFDSKVIAQQYLELYAEMEKQNS